MGNTRLKIAIIKSGREGYEIARELNWHPTKVSQIKIGAHRPSFDEKRQLAVILDKVVSELFPEPHPTVAA